MFSIIVFALVAGVIHPQLQTKLDVLPDNEPIEIIVHMREQYPYDDVAYLSNQGKVRIFRNIAHTSQQPLVEFLKQYPEKVFDIEQFWVFNGINLECTKAIIEKIAQRNDVWFISHNAKIQLPPTEKGKEIPSRAIEWNIQIVMADSCWAAGYTGDSVYLAILDTGVDTAHPALEGNFGGYWNDLVNNLPDPYDDHGHGTHKAGIMCGGDGFGPFTNDIGVAPNALLIVAKIFDSQGSGSTNDIHDAFQWIASLKADSGINVRAGNNSWGNITSLEFWDDCLLWKSLEILPVFSIGNGGPGPGTAGTPGNFPINIGSGATDSGDNVASFSGRGPAPNQSPWNDPQYWYRPDWDLIKPDMAAPGVNIRSSIPGGGYASTSGTSDAAAHVTGTMALMCELNPGLNITDMYNYLVENADHPSQGAPYPNNNYGWGRLNCWATLCDVMGIDEEVTYPVRSNFYIGSILSGPLRLPTDHTYVIYDITGRKINIPNPAPGIYFIEEDGKLVNKVIKIK